MTESKRMYHYLKAHDMDLDEYQKLKELLFDVQAIVEDSRRFYTADQYWEALCAAIEKMEKK